MNSERKRWTELAERNAYWAVLDEPRYRADRIGQADVAAFFQTGERHIADTLSSIRAYIAPDFRSRCALDYGCGLGRLVIPMARECDHVVGVDISDPMLREAKVNCARRGITNFDFVPADEFLAAPADRFSFDFVHSFIVLQHIVPRVGLAISDCILQRLTPGGVGALQFTYARRASLLRRAVHPLRRRFRSVNVAVNLLQGTPALEPLIPMYEYDLVELFELFKRHNCASIRAELTDHGGHLGAMFLFRKQVPNRQR